MPLPCCYCSYSSKGSHKMPSLHSKEKALAAKTVFASIEKQTDCFLLQSGSFGKSETGRCGFQKTSFS